MTPLANAELLRRLIAFDSTSHNSNLPIAEFICDYLDVDGIDIIRQPDHTGDKVNLVVIVGGKYSIRGQAGEGLALSGHLDVVPAVEPEWQTDPFHMAEDETHYYGRGVADMRGFVALAVNAARRFAKQPLSMPLVLLLTFDEEVGLLGAQHFEKHWRNERPLPRSMIVGEPTEMRVVRMHKGHLSMRVSTRGRGAHSAFPHLGHNAIVPAARVIAALDDLRLAMESERTETSPYFPESPFVILNVAMVRGGEAVNIIPPACTIDLGLRLLPGMEAAPLVERVRGAVLSLGIEPAPEIVVINDGPALLSPTDTPLHGHLCSLTGQAEGEAVSYASDAGVFSRMGFACLVWGPGTIEVAHKPNERISKDELHQYAEQLDGVMNRACFSLRA